MSILSVLVAVLFGAFEMGTRIFRDTNVRQSTENQLRSIKLLLERDANHTNIWLCNKNPAPRSVTVGSDTFQRDALSMATLKDWDAPGSYSTDEESLRAMFDRYVVWYATTEVPQGKLFRQLVDPPPVSGGFTTPYAGLSSNINNNPELNANVFHSRPMSSDVMDFATGVNFGNGTITVTLRLKADGELRPGTQVRTEENLQVSFMFQPKNSWPQI